MLPLVLLSAALAAPPGWAVAPLGVGVYVHGKPVRGAIYTATQAAGIATLSVATVEAYAAAEAEDDATFDQWQGISIAGVTVTAVSYLASVLDASRLHELEAQEGASARARVEAWDDARALADLRRAGAGSPTALRAEDTDPRAARSGGPAGAPLAVAAEVR